MKYDVTFSRIGSAVIEAKSEAQALEIAQNYGENEVLWTDYDATDVVAHDFDEDAFEEDDFEESCRPTQSLDDEPDFDYEDDEYIFMVDFAENNGFDEDICRDQFRMLWTSFCLHNDLDPDTVKYDNNLRKLWAVVEREEECTADWSDFSSFEDFMSKYLV